MNLPNALSLLRLIMVPGFVVVFLSDLPNAHRWAGAIFLVAAMTDALDGYIARTYNKITKLGRFLDPLADKLMTFAALVCMCIGGMVSLWIIVVFFLKELLMGIGSLVLFKRLKDVLPSNILGKLSTVVFFTFLLVVMLFNPHPVTTGVLMIIALVLTLLALVMYTYNAIMIINTKSNDGTRHRKGK